MPLKQRIEIGRRFMVRTSVCSGNATLSGEAGGIWKDARRDPARTDTTNGPVSIVRSPWPRVDADGVNSPVAQCPGEVRGTLERAEYMLNIAEKALADVTLEDTDKPGFRRFIKRTPLGVVLVIAPWKYVHVLSHTCCPDHADYISTRISWPAPSG